ncbi:GNAT family N-acetyltransferase [Lactiplantibacillus fabifermentans]|uniref:N-acetyltransferase domain-containing protein n=2 Tax=Lactiplantibacillus fabifermentans TaxID=483011 RepID=A0A0R2NSZ7_9LACO|nr:GNAT family N-acetyltransferase [Lactiplantibacillus fabifermentans]ETY75684.1 GNAT family acetyltransferase [Lactiplantibacillus fabifermentans T30PCM01]KRO28799.1 hypothetical protein DY78_GL001980 [Lactiplantibacillus fabifermentans DSM 21115]
MTPISYRYSTSADLPALLAIDQTIWNVTNSPGPSRVTTLADYQQANPVGSQLVAVRGTQVLGMISWNPQPPFESMRYTWNIGIGVALTAQHQGVGSGLMQALKLAAKQQGIHRIELRVLATNTTARQFYAQQGFEVEGVARDAFYLNGRFIDDYSLAYLI